MSQQDKDRRVHQLVDALRQATDREVFFVMPLLFTEQALRSAKKANVCSAEIDSSMANVSDYMTAQGATQENFPEAHASKIREDTEKLIHCLHQYYENGQLKFTGET
jgi:hypothetical protein